MHAIETILDRVDGKVAQPIASEVRVTIKWEGRQAVGGTGMPQNGAVEGKGGLVEGELARVPQTVILLPPSRIDCNTAAVASDAPAWDDLPRSIIDAIEERRHGNYPRSS